MPRILKRLLWWSSNDQIGQVCSKASSDFSLTPKNFLRFWSSLEGVTVVRCAWRLLLNILPVGISQFLHSFDLQPLWTCIYTCDLIVCMSDFWLVGKKRFKAFIKSLDYARKILCDFPNAWQIIEGALKLDNLVLSKKIGKVAFWIISYRFLYKGPDDSE